VPIYWVSDSTRGRPGFLWSVGRIVSWWADRKRVIVKGDGTAKAIDRMVGRRYMCDFRVVAIGDVPPNGTEMDRSVTLMHMGDQATIGYGELLDLILSGFVQEVGES
jgi:hypothetical protein